MGLMKTALFLLAILSWCLCIAENLNATEPPPPTAGELTAAVKTDDQVKLNELLRKGADLNGRDADGMTPLICAAYRHSLPSVQALLDGGADVNARDSLGMAPLHAAAYEGATDVVKLLLARGADPSARDSGGHAPLEYAKASGHQDVATMLSKPAPAAHPRSYTNEDLARLHDSGSLLLPERAVPLRHDEGLPAEAGAQEGPHQQRAEKGPGENASALPRAKVRTISSDEVLDIDCEEGKKTTLILTDVHGGDSEVLITSQEKIRAMLHWKTDMNGSIARGDGTLQSGPISVLRPTGQAQFYSDVTFNGGWVPAGNEQRCTAPCLNSGIGVMCVYGSVEVEVKKE